MDYFAEIKKLRPDQDVFIFFDKGFYNLIFDKIIVKTVTSMELLSDYLYELLKIDIARIFNYSVKSIQIFNKPPGVSELVLKDKVVYTLPNTKYHSAYDSTLHLMISYLESLDHAMIFSNYANLDEHVIIEKLRDYMFNHRFYKGRIVFKENGIVYDMSLDKIAKGILNDKEVIFNQMDGLKYQFIEGKMQRYIEEKKFDPKKPFSVYDKILEFKSTDRQVITLNNAMFSWIENGICVYSSSFENNYVLTVSTTLHEEQTPGPEIRYIVLDGKFHDVEKLRYLFYPSSTSEMKLFEDYPNKFDMIIDEHGNASTKFGLINLKEVNQIQSFPIFEFTDSHTGKFYNLRFGEECRWKSISDKSVTNFLNGITDTTNNEDKNNKDIYHYLTVKFVKHQVVEYFNKHFDKVQYIVFPDGTYASIFAFYKKVEGMKFIDSLNNCEMRITSDSVNSVRKSTYLMCNRTFNFTNDNIRNNLVREGVDYLVSESRDVYYLENEFIVCKHLEPGFEFVDSETNMIYVVCKSGVHIKMNDKEPIFYYGNFNEENETLIQSVVFGQVVNSSGIFYLLKNSYVISSYKLTDGTEFIDDMTTQTMKVTEKGVVIIHYTTNFNEKSRGWLKNQHASNQEKGDVTEMKTTTTTSDIKEKETLQMFVIKLNKLEEKLDYLINKNK